MKIQLYAVQSLDGAGSIIRKKDGFYTRLNPSNMVKNPFSGGRNYYIDDEGLPIDQKYAETVEKQPILSSRSIASVMYKIPDDVEIYDI